MFRYLFTSLAFVIVYFISGRLGLELSSINGYASLVWPPTGIGIGFLLICGIQYLPAIFVGATISNLLLGASTFASLGIGVGNSAEAAFAVMLLQQLGFDKSQSQLRDSVLLIVIGGLLAPLLSATIGAGSLVLFKSISIAQFELTWKSWWAGNFLSVVIVTPVILSWFYFFKLKQKFENKFEALFVTICILSTFSLFFFRASPSLKEISFQLPFLFFPFVIWAALRFRQIGASTLTLMTAVFALWGTGYNYGPFVYSVPEDSPLFIHTFLAVLSITGLIVASMTSERAQTKDVLESALLELEKRGDQLDAILKGINESISVIDQNDRFVYTNDISASTFGFNSVDEIMQHSATEVLSRLEILDENGLPFPQEKLPHRLALSGVKNPDEVVIHFRIKDSNIEKWSIVKASPMINSKTKERLAVTVFNDFTERKRLEDSIKHLAEASHLFNSSLDYEVTLTKIAKMIVPHIADWCVIDIIKYGENTPHTIAVEHVDPGKLEFAKKLVHKYPKDWSPENGPGLVLKTGQSILTTEITDEMLRLSCKNEEHYQMVHSLGLKSAMIVPIHLRNKIFGVISFYSAESRRQYKQADLRFAEELARRGGIAIDNALLFAEMEKLAEDAKNANQIKSLFLANMSHEIRTPLGAILGFNALISNPHISDSDRIKYAEIIARNGHQLTQLIDDILDLSKVEADRLDIEILEIDLPSLITDITSLMNQKAKEKGLFLNVTSEDPIPPVIYSDPTRLRQILLNIIGNAIKFTVKGGVKVIVKIEPQNSHTPNKIIIDIEDTGSGIPKENQSRLFEWFTQADSTTTRKFGGTGLGLALSRRLAKALRGNVELIESSDQGSKFRIQIVNQVQEFQHRPLVQTKESYLNNRPSRQEQLKGLRVLLADDSPDNRTLIECILEQSGAIIDSAENGREAIEKAMHHEYDLVLMDIQMPVCDGLQATKELRSKGYQKPIVALTAHAMKEEREKTLSMGCNAHLTKPIEIPRLLNIVAELSHQYSQTHH